MHDGIGFFAFFALFAGGQSMTRSSAKGKLLPTGDGEDQEKSGPPLQAEAAAIRDARARLSRRAPRVKVAIKQQEDGSVLSIGPEHTDFSGWLARLEDVFGSPGRPFVISQLNELIKSCQLEGSKIDNNRLNAMIAMVEAASPVNELQAALSVQMAVMHFALLTVTRRALRVDQIPQFDSAGNMAVKLARTFVIQAEVLAKLQRGGEQVVKVVHVHPGAQAIVGNVVTNAPRGTAGGGGTDEKPNQPHAPEQSTGPARCIEAQCDSTMPRQDTAGECVPVPSGER